MNHQLRMTLTKQIANRIDSDLSQIALIPQAMAATLSERDDWPHHQLLSWMEAMLAKDARLYGTCVAFEAFVFHPRIENYAPYVYRKDNVERMLIGDAYRDLPWYADPKNRQEAMWTEPFFDSEGGKIFMVTYSVPIMRKKSWWRMVTEERFVGVATADLSITYFDQLRKWLDELKLGKAGYGFVLSPTGTFISHPNADYKFPKKISEVAAFQDDRDLKKMTQRLLQHESGSARVVDPYTGKSSVYYFAPIPSAQWTLVVVVEE